MDDDLKQRIEFLVEIDKIKQIFRHTKLFDQSRTENDAEHSWHLAMMAIVLAEYSNQEIDLLKVIKMVLIHDIVEIDAGDYIVYSSETDKKQEEELKAAKRIFGLLPQEIGQEFYDLWHEFEENKTAEAQFASALDRLEPVLQNYFSKAEVWNEHNISAKRVKSVNKIINKGSKDLWAYALGLIEELENQDKLK